MLVTQQQLDARRTALSSNQQQLDTLNVKIATLNAKGARMREMGREIHTALIVTKTDATALLEEFKLLALEHEELAKEIELEQAVLMQSYGTH